MVIDRTDSASKMVFTAQRRALGALITGLLPILCQRPSRFLTPRDKADCAHKKLRIKFNSAPSMSTASRRGSQTVRIIPLEREMSEKAKHSTCTPFRIPLRIRKFSGQSLRLALFIIRSIFVELIGREQAGGSQA